MNRNVEEPHSRPLLGSRNTGRVYLIGAGPGAPEYLTLRAAKVLSQCDVVLCDYLTLDEALKHTSAGCERISLGKHGEGRIWSQDEINRTLVDLAKEGKIVGRLKSGDPAIFGRMAEEIATLEANGIPYEIVPGITAALAASSLASIPVTHRDVASAVAFVTGHECEDKEVGALNYAALASFPGTLVFYMGVTSVSEWSSGLLKHGKSPETPVVVIRKVSQPDQFVMRCTLGDVVQRMTTPKKLRPPIVFVVGEAGGEVLSRKPWFKSRPLFGKTVMVTRPIGQANDLAEPLRELGATVVLQPTIQISPPESYDLLDSAIARLQSYDWIAFSSANGVRAVLDRVLSLGGDLRVFGGVRLAAIGPATAQELSRHYLRADRVPDENYRAESLSQALGGEVQSKRVLLIRASRGREALADGLRSLGALVEQVVAYQSLDVDQPDVRNVERLQSGQIDWVTVTSSAIARSLGRMFGPALAQAKLVSISPITSATLRELGYVVAAEATEYTTGGVVDAIRRA